MRTKALKQRIKYLKSKQNQNYYRKFKDYSKNKLSQRSLKLKLKYKINLFVIFYSYLVNNLKLTHYLESYIEESIASKGLVIPSQ